MILSVVITGLIMLALMGLVNTATEAGDNVRSSNDLTRQARFAMQRMVRYAGHSRKLMLPLRDNPASNWPENIREQTVPASAPIGDSTLATAVLAVTLPAFVDLDQDGYPRCRRRRRRPHRRRPAERRHPRLLSRHHGDRR